MVSAYRLCKSAFRRIAPPGAKSFFFNGRTWLSRAVLSLKGRMENAAPHADVYDATYYANYSDEMQHSAVGIANSVIDAFRPSSIIDIGCGSGEVLAEFAGRGIKARGADLSPASLEICRKKGLKVDCLDLEDVSSIPDWQADVVISTEVAEHLPAQFADHYVRLLTSMAQKAIVITAAPPGQGGTNHVNEQPPAYWIEKLKKNGAALDSSLTRHFQERWQRDQVEKSRARNVLVFTIHR